MSVIKGVSDGSAWELGKHIGFIDEEGNVVEENSVAGMGNYPNGCLPEGKLPEGARTVDQNTTRRDIENPWSADEMGNTHLGNLDKKMLASAIMGAKVDAEYVSTIHGHEVKQLNEGNWVVFTKRAVRRLLQANGLGDVDIKDDDALNVSVSSGVLTLKYPGGAPVFTITSDECEEILHIDNGGKVGFLDGVHGHVQNAALKNIPGQHPGIFEE